MLLFERQLDPQLRVGWRVAIFTFVLGQLVILRLVLFDKLGIFVVPTFFAGRGAVFVGSAGYRFFFFSALS